MNIESISAKLSGKTYTAQELENAVFDAVCGLSDSEWKTLANLSLEPEGTSANNSRAQYLYPNFADPTLLGDFDNLEAAQDLCQRIYNAVAANIEG